MNREPTGLLQRRTGSAVEPSELTEVGPLLGLFDDRLNVGVDYSDEYQKDRLLKANAPYSAILYIILYILCAPVNVCFILFSDLVTKAQDN